MLTNQNLINVLHIKHVKKSVYSACLVIHSSKDFAILKENHLIIMGGLPFLKFKN
jgi:hypothetical protein